MPADGTFVLSWDWTETRYSDSPYSLQLIVNGTRHGEREQSRRCPWMGGGHYLDPWPPLHVMREWSVVIDISYTLIWGAFTSSGSRQNLMSKRRLGRFCPQVGLVSVRRIGRPEPRRGPNLFLHQLQSANSIGGPRAPSRPRSDPAYISLMYD